MTTVTRRRSIVGGLLLVAIFAFWLYLEGYASSLRNPRFLDGWVLLIGLFLLTLLNVRKKVPQLPLWPVAHWLRFHVYVAWFVVAAFAFHTKFELPGGLLDIMIWYLFVFMAISGFAGLFLSMKLPRYLAQLGPPVLFEQFAPSRALLANDVKERVSQLMSVEASETLSRLYLQSLQPYFGRMSFGFGHLAGTPPPLAQVKAVVEGAKSSVGEKTTALLVELLELAVEKDRLDRQYTLQRILRFWLFFHIPIAWSLLIFVIVHAVSAYGFSAGAP
jgi:hypothetical protein